MTERHLPRKRHNEFNSWKNARTTSTSGNKPQAQPPVPPLWGPSRKDSPYLLQVMTETQIHQSTMTSKLPRPPDALHQLQHIWTHQMLLKIPLPTPPRMPPRMQTTTMPLPLPLLLPLPLALSLPTNMVHQPTRRPALMSGYENTQGNVRVATPTFRNAGK